MLLHIANLILTESYNFLNFLYFISDFPDK